ncbi:MAG: sigma-70 family RNA polymerase sigma factor [Deltaproteobacteria bacterium]|nr:sigma-70 family RNA polymerase sigma factor [Deltaproteobacteria bacterium]
MELDDLTVRKAQAGDRSAQDMFLRRYAKPMHALIFRCGFAAQADDLTQDLLEKLLCVLPDFDPRGSAQLSTWVYTVAHRWLLDVRKKRHLALVPLEDGLEIPDERPRADVHLERRELRACLESAIGRLPETQRRVFVLAQVHAQPLEAIASVEGIPVGTVKSRLHRARAALVSLLNAGSTPAQGGLGGHVG